MTKRTYSQIFDNVADDHLPANLNLAPAIINRIQKGNSSRMQFKRKLVPVLLITVMALVVMAFTVPEVKAAIARWFGYIPGVGLVSEGQIRTLEEPVSVARDGVTVTVEQVILNGEKTSLIYSVDGISAEAQTIQPDETFCSYLVNLRLPDGSELRASPNGVDAWETGYRHRFDFQSLPADVNDAALQISCLFQTKPNSAPEGWEIPLHFVPAPADMTVYPVIEISSPTDAVETGPVSTDSAANLTADFVQLSLDRAVPMDGGYLIYSTLNWNNTGFGEVNLVDIPETVHVIDANGQEIPFEIINDENTGIHYEQRQTVFAVKTSPVQSGTLTLAIDALLVNMPVEPQQFEFDPGVNAQPGQKWQPNLEFTFGEYKLRIDTITLEQGGGYSFEMFSDTGIRKAGPVDVDHSIVTGYEGEGVDDSHFFSGFYYAEGLPEGPVNFTISGIFVKQPVQQMQAQWTPTEASSVSTAEALPIQSAICLTPEKWQAGLNQPPVIPAGLPGKVVMYGPVDPANPNGAWETALVSLDGSQRQSVVAVEKGIVSPDGMMIAYKDAAAGIMIKNLATEETALLQGTSAGDSDPLWSPDGKKVVFLRNVGIFDLFIVNLGGTGLQQLTFGGPQEIPLTWLADGSLLYDVYDINGTSVYRVDLQSGENRLFSNDDIRSVSRDGKYLAITKLLMGDRWQIVIDETEGSKSWELTDSRISVLNPIWSPDGQWMLATVLDNAGPAKSALISLATCDIIPLPNLQDDVLAWIP